MRHAAFDRELTRQDLLSWYREVRARTRMLFSLITEDAYYDRPIALRNPIVFYEGHFPAFAVNTLIKLALRQPGIDEPFERLFERGIDPADASEVRSPRHLWPAREQVQAYGAEADALIESALAEAVLEDERVPQLRGGEAAIAILEHEAMHHETLLYMFHNLPFDRKVPPPRTTPPLVSRSSPRGSVRIPAGVATLGAVRGDAFGWDNEFPANVVNVGEFTIDVDNVTNGDYLDYMTATGAAAPHFWTGDGTTWQLRGMFELLALPLDAPVWVTQAEAWSYARWRGRRLPTEAEYHRAAYGDPSGEERIQPWGDAAADSTRGNFDFASWDPVAIGSYRDGASAWGVNDLVGNGWEWTATPFGGFAGFEPMPSYPVYSADFFDGAHFVLKGASPVTARQLVRRSFRNWFRPNYPYVFATFRCVR